MDHPARTPVALVVSATFHVAVISLALVGFHHYGSSAQESGFVRQRVVEAVVWNGWGGGGGGGDHDPAPARKSESPGRDVMTLQPAPPTPVRATDLSVPSENPPAPTLVDVSLQPLALGTEVQPGIPDGVPGSRSLGPGSDGGAGTGKGGGAGPGRGRGGGPGEDRNTGGGPPGSSGLVVPPRLLREVKPLYTPEAMRARIQGMAVVDCLVTTDGSVADARIVRSLDREWGLDAEAVKAARQWRFVPGMLNGRPVPMRVRIELLFSLK